MILRLLCCDIVKCFCNGLRINCFIFCQSIVYENKIDSDHTICPPFLFFGCQISAALHFAIKLDLILTCYIIIKCFMLLDQVDITFPKVANMEAVKVKSPICQ